MLHVGGEIGRMAACLISHCESTLRIGPRHLNLSRLSFLGLALLMLLVGTGASVGGPDVTVDFEQPAEGPVHTLRFELGSNELYDLLMDGGVSRIRELGVTRVRIWMGHRFLGTAVRSTAPFDFDWGLLYTYVQRVLDANAIPHISFVAAPAWVPAVDGRPSSQHESEVFAADGRLAFANYVAETVARLEMRFGPEVLDWPYAIWNEPNNHQNAGLHYACGRGAGYVALFTQTRRVIDERFGAGRVRLGGPSLDAIDTGVTVGPDGTPRCGTLPDLGWEEYLRAVDAGAEFDFLTWHWYGMFRIGEADTQDVLLSRLRWFEDRVHTVDTIAAGRPHFIEEININGDLAADPLIDEQVNAAFLASAVLRAIRQGASGMLVYKGTRAAGGVAPGGEPDFGLWANSFDEGPTAPAFHALRLLQRFIGSGSRLARISVTALDVDGMAIVGPRGPALAIVNLSDEPRRIRISGVQSGPFVYVDKDNAWGRDWFDGEYLHLEAHAVAVVTADSVGLATPDSVKRGSEVFSDQTSSPSCSACHATDALGGPGPTLRTADSQMLASSHAAAGLSVLERADIVAYLRALGVDSPHRFTGVVRRADGQLVSGAWVLATSGAHTRVVTTDSAGRFEIQAARGEQGSATLSTEIVVLHPQHRIASVPKERKTVTLDSTELVFELEPCVDGARPLVASPYAVPLALPGVFAAGVATAGDSLTVWAIDDEAGLALRLDPVLDHPFGLHQRLYSNSAMVSAGRPWRFIAIGPAGIPSEVIALPIIALPKG